MTVQNLAEFNAQMTKAIPAAMIAGIKQTIGESAAPVVAQMKSLAPYDATGKARRHPEHLRDTIRFKWIDPKDAAGPLALKLVFIAGSAGTEVLASKQREKRFQLARMIEFGTQREAARPFFFPIWRAYRRGLRRKLSSQVNKVIIQYSNTSTTSSIAA